MPDKENLSLPEKTGISDPGAGDLDSSESDDHFSDAQSGHSSPPRASSIPRTRVEKVDDEPSYGEVPGTAAYNLRENDAEADEIAIIPDRDTPDKENSRSSPEDSQPQKSTTDIPITILEEAPGPSHPHSIEYDRRHVLDPSPDRVLRADIEEEANGGSETVDAQNTPVPRPASPSSSASSEVSQTQQSKTTNVGADGGEDGDGESDFGDDFDDFEEGGEDADFGDFEDDFQHPEELQAQTPAKAPSRPSMLPGVPLPFPVPDFDGLEPDEISTILDSHIDTLFPFDNIVLPELPPPSKENPIFTTSRSASLWSQLVAPPPLAPPDWIRSRIRRLFLVSLGVPVDLDEILPASKQKKLVLPSLQVPSSGSPRTSTESRSASRAKQQGANSSNDSQGRSSSSRRRKDGPHEPDFNLVSSKQLCMTTDEALSGMTEQELRDHITTLKSIESKANEALEYWMKRTDEKIGDRETFEGVIENLVKHARKVRN